jgi:transposase
MVTIGVDPHKDTHSAAAVDPVGQELAKTTKPARIDGFDELLDWGRNFQDPERAWVIEDCRHVSGRFERFLLDHGETVIRLPPILMAGARPATVRERGKSDPIDALAIARVALREGLDTLPTARLAGPELEIRLLCVHRQRLVDARTRLTNQLRWELHDIWPGWNTSRDRMARRPTQQQISRRLNRAEATVRVRIARDLIRRIIDLTKTIEELYAELAEKVQQAAPQLLAEKGLGVITAAKLIGEIAGIQRFSSDAQLARLAGCAPVPVSSGRTDRYRLDRGGNRQLNHAIHMLALSRIRHDPATAVYIARQRARGKTQREAIRCLKRHLVRRVYNLLSDPSTVSQTVCLT